MSQAAQIAGPGTGQPQGGALAGAAAQEQAASQAVANAPRKQVELPKVAPIRRELPKLGRNAVVTIRKGSETKELKFKKAETLIHNDGWELVQK
jgi:preprotein translocase subunit SecA